MSMIREGIGFVAAAGVGILVGASIGRVIDERTGLITQIREGSPNRAPTGCNLVNINPADQIQDVESRTCTICLTNDLQLAHADPASLTNRAIIPTLMTSPKYTHGMCEECFVEYAATSAAALSCPSCRAPIGHINNVPINKYLQGKNKLTQEIRNAIDTGINTGSIDDIIRLCTKDDNGSTLDQMIMYAASKKDSDPYQNNRRVNIMRLLLEYSYPNYLGVYPLAFEKALLAKNADILRTLFLTNEVKTYLFKETLIKAVDTGDLELLNALFEFGYNELSELEVYAQIGNINNVFVQAASNGKVEVLKRLIQFKQSGLNGDKKSKLIIDSVVAKALNSAAFNGHQEVIDLLSEYQAIASKDYAIASASAAAVGKFTTAIKLTRMAIKAGTSEYELVSTITEAVSAAKFAEEA